MTAHRQIGGARVSVRCSILTDEGSTDRDSQ